MAAAVGVVEGHVEEELAAAYWQFPKYYYVCMIMRAFEFTSRVLVQESPDQVLDVGDVPANLVYVVVLLRLLKVESVHPLRTDVLLADDARGDVAPGVAEDPGQGAHRGEAGEVVHVVVQTVNAVLKKTIMEGARRTFLKQLATRTGYY